MVAKRLMTPNALKLLTRRRFLPLFATQFLGAFNDNLFKAALAILITYGAIYKLSIEPRIMVNIAQFLFVLPFFLFSATAGQLAERYEKSKLIQYTKLFEILLTALATIGFITDNFWLLLAALFLLGTQSTFFGPLKYSILPDHLRENELIGGNGLIAMGTFVAILLGTVLGGVMIIVPKGDIIVSTLLFVLAMIGWLASRAIPQSLPPLPDLVVRLNPITQTWALLKHAAKRREILLSILGISWFWMIGIVYLTLTPVFGKEVLGADKHVAVMFMTAFTIGIALGSFACNYLVKGSVSAAYVPLGALGMTLFGVDIYLSSSELQTVTSTLLTPAEFIRDPAHCRILIDLTLFAACGGIYVVPLYAILQARSAKEHRSRNIASLNILNALFMVVATIISFTLLQNDFTIPQVFLIFALASAVVALYICRLLPQGIVKVILRRLLHLAYGVEIHGLENYDKLGDKAIIIVNHTSFLDGLLLGSFLPDIPTTAMNTHIAQHWWAKPALALFHILTVDPTNPMTVKTMIKHVRAGNKLIIFPEGRISVTGALMKVYEGPGAIAFHADAPLLPIRIDGALYTMFSRVRGKHPVKWRPKITITVLPPTRFDIPEDVRGRARRQLIGAQLYDIMSDMIFATSHVQQTLFKALLRAKRLYGAKQEIAEDIQRKPVTYGRIVLASFVLGGRIAKLTRRQEAVGVLLPNSVPTVATFFGLMAYARTPAMLNFSAGLKNMRAACETAQIKTIITSHRFIALAKLDDTAAELAKDYQLIYLEDLQQQITLGDKLVALLASSFANNAYRLTGRNASANDTAVILFTSGSEGVPKAVVLSHANIQANRYQLCARIDFNPTDTIFNALPIFHSFGLTGGLLLPLLTGTKTFLYPSPLHYRVVPQLIYDCNATIMFGTDTFLTGYARKAHPYDFYSIRYIFAGAEKVKPETRAIYAEKFGVRLLEGYGATETSPVLAVNTPMQNQSGTVGRLLPGIEYRLQPVEGITTGGRLEVRGPNIMRGYIKHDRPGVLVPPEDGWYDTGDIVEINSEGYITIVGRAKRFAKIAGEMVSLSAVEIFISEVWPDHAHAIVSLPDARKGEQLILATAYKNADRKTLQSYAQQHGIAELMVPKRIIKLDKIPVLGTGKTDYVSLTEIVSSS